MSNDVATAERWTQFLASRSYLPRADLVLAHFTAGQITRICDCGCNSYDLTVPASTTLEPLVPASGRGGSVLELSLRTTEPAEPARTVEFTIFVDARGYLAGIDVDYCSNSAPMPDHVSLIEPPFHVHGALLGETSNYRLERP